CPHCHIPLLTGERAEFCCGRKGARLAQVAPLPDLPEEYGELFQDPHISQLSRKLNLMLSFASMETTMHFPNTDGMVAIQGKVYHRVRPSHDNSSIRWILYDGMLPNLLPHATYLQDIPVRWVQLLTSALLRVNPFARALRILSLIPPAIAPPISITLEDSGASSELAAIFVFDNTALSDVRGR
ncbi:hypothetical protein NEOLEDRAFT_1041328, partial [Neolentinus lepideus HHB14362 ss-1]